MSWEVVLPMAFLVACWLGIAYLYGEIRATNKQLKQLKETERILEILRGEKPKG